MSVSKDSSAAANELVSNYFVLILLAVTMKDFDWWVSDEPEKVIYELFLGGHWPKFLMCVKHFEDLLILSTPGKV